MAVRFPLLVMLPLALCCGDPGVAPRQELPPTARGSIVESLRAELALEQHPADGAGRAWLEPGPDGPVRATAGRPGRFVIVFEAGPLGVAPGGRVLLQVAPFWGWSTPQVLHPEALGYTTVETAAAGVELEARTADQQLLAIAIRGRALAAGERLRIDYGAGPAGALADRYAERGSRFWIGVDGDGDGVRGWLAESPAVDVEPGPPARLVLSLPSTARPGSPVVLTAALLDAQGNAGVDFAGELLLELPEGLVGASALLLAPEAGGHGKLALRAERPGVVRVRARGPGGLVAESNPMLVDPDAPLVLWGDLHGHSAYSDGTGTPEDYFRYARDVAGLDVTALTDHDHWGIPFLDQSPALWQEIQETTRRFYEPGRFVTLLGYEWTNWIHGHRHVLHFQDEAALLSSLDPATDDPAELWAALRGQPALTFAHHSAGGPVATDWSFEPDPELEPVTEIVSVHGSSEAPDAPAAIYAPVAGNFVRDVLARGYQLGFIGSGDSHDGHPGLAHLSAPSGGLAAIFAEARSREAVLAALRARRVYATNGPRILLAASLGGRPMGATLPPGDHSLQLEVVAAGPLERVELIRGAQVAAERRFEAVRQASLSLLVEDLRVGEALYLRVLQSDGGAAWSSPFFIEAAEAGR